MSAFGANLQFGSDLKQLSRSVAIYYLIACGWAWLAWSPVVLGTDGLKLLPITASLPVFSCIATLGPFFGGFIAYRLEYGNWRAVRLLPASRLRSIWLLLGPMLILLAMFVLFPALISRGGPGLGIGRRRPCWGFGCQCSTTTFSEVRSLRSLAGGVSCKRGYSEKSHLGLRLSVWGSCGRPGISPCFSSPGAAQLHLVTCSSW